MGETLGEALVGLLESMYEYRSGGSVDNVADLVRYLQVEGYLSLARQPDHALAVLRLAETFRLKTLYLEALSHCVAMGDLVYGRPDLQVGSPERFWHIMMCFIIQFPNPILHDDARMILIQTAAREFSNSGADARF